MRRRNDKHAEERVYDHLALALANALVYSVSNLRFGPEVGVGGRKDDAPVIAAWLAEVGKIAEDLQIADEIERRRVELGKTSGFERLYSKVTRPYLGMGEGRRPAHAREEKPLLADD